MVFRFVTSLFLKTRSLLGDGIRKLFSRSIDEDTLERLEEILYTADLGTKTTLELVEDIRSFYKKNSAVDGDAVLERIRQQLARSFEDLSPHISLTSRPTVILIVGVNGNGKTTTAAKLALHYKNQGKKVVLAAADTFRAAAVEQLTLWSQKIGVPLIKGAPDGDPAAVAHDALQSSLSGNADLLLIDTAGRLHTKLNLMKELEKIKRVLGKLSDRAPHEVLLVIDATIGQNAIEQARIFHRHTPLTGIILTKLDGTAKGGIVIAIQKELGIPVKFIGTGEGAEDLQPFDSTKFIAELLQ